MSILRVAQCDDSFARESKVSHIFDAQEQYLINASFEMACCAHDAGARKRRACDVLLATYDRADSSVLKAALPLLECARCNETITGAMCHASGRSSHIVAAQNYSIAYDIVLSHPIETVALDYISGAFVGACASLDITRALALYMICIAKMSTDNTDHTNDFSELSTTPARVMRDGIVSASTARGAQVDDIADLITCLCAKPVIACVTAKGEQIDVRNLLKWVMRDDVINYMDQEGMRTIDC